MCVSMHSRSLVCVVVRVHDPMKISKFLHLKLIWQAVAVACVTGTHKLVCLSSD